jgi:transposase InsO family protein
VEGHRPGIDQDQVHAELDQQPATTQATLDDVELATLAWVHWWNSARLQSAIGDIPPDEFEAAHYAQQPPATPAEVH